MPATRHAPLSIPAHALTVLQRVLPCGLSGLLPARQGDVDPVGLTQLGHAQTAAGTDGTVSRAQDDP